jgi:sterol desaturase/sphingolipid hydroxylase (fatty acid hydroxylase superfamily)
MLSSASSVLKRIWDIEVYKYR